MDDNTIQDLKQFIATTVGQHTTEIREDMIKMEQRLDKKIDKLDKKMDDGFAAVGEAVGRIHDENAMIDRRTTKLEQQAA